MSDGNSPLHNRNTAHSALQYLDTGSGEVNGALTPGNIGTINGHRLKFDPAKPDEGVFLVPALKAGDYHLEARVRLNNGTELRAGRLGPVLTVSKKDESPDGNKEE